MRPSPFVIGIWIILLIVANLGGEAKVPTKKPTRTPTRAPTTWRPSISPQAITASPNSRVPTKQPTSATPSISPTASPTRKPTNQPTRIPTTRPTRSPTVSPTVRPSAAPTTSFSGYFFQLAISNVNITSIAAPATPMPSISPSLAPTRGPSTLSPFTRRPTLVPSKLPTPFVGRRQLVAAPTDLRYMLGVWEKMRQSLFCLLDFILDLKDVDLLTLRLYLEVIDAQPCVVKNFVLDAPSCFPVIVQVGIEPKELADLDKWSTQNVTAFLQVVSKYTQMLSTLGTVTAPASQTRVGKQRWRGEEQIALATLFDVFKGVAQPTNCRDIYLNQTARRQIESGLATPAPSSLRPTASPSHNGTMASGGDNAGLIVGLVFFFLILFACLGFGYYYWKKRMNPNNLEEAKKGLGSIGPNGSRGPGPELALHPLLRKTTGRYAGDANSGSSVSFPSNPSLLPSGASVSSTTSNDFEFSIDLSKLKLGKVIGSGANGRIFSARYAGSDVAVKELFAHDVGDDDESVKNSPALVIKREFDNLRRLKHPHVIQLFGLAYARSAETGSPRYLLVMELADTSLDKVLNKKMLKFETGQATPGAGSLGGIGGSSSLILTVSSISTEKLTTRGSNDVISSPSSSAGLPPPPPMPIHPMTDAEHFQWALDIARQIASGLAFVHDRGLIHFDVKPHNILLDKAGTVKLCDLGISKMVTKQSDLTLTSPGRAGTPSYMSPELLRADVKLIGTPVDVYAFAIVFWQLLHLKPPHPKEWTIAQLFDAVLHQNHRPAIDPLTDPRVTSLIERCWKENPADRPNFLDIMKEIDEIALSTQPGEMTDEFLVGGEKLELEEAIFSEGEKVQIFSAAVGLVKGVVTAVSTEGGKRVYDVLLTDGSMMVGVSPAELIPMKKLSPTPEAKKRPAPLELLDPKNATVGDVAAALAIARADERRRKGVRRGSVIEGGGSNSIFPLLSNNGSRVSSGLNSPKSAARSAGMLRLGKRIWRSREQPSPSLRDDSSQHTDARTPPATQPSSPIMNEIAKSSGMMNMPALTPFSLRFLNRDEEQAMEGGIDPTEDTAETAAAPHGGHDKLNQTFKYDGAVLEMKGLLVSEGGLSSNGSAGATRIDEQLSIAGSKYAGKLFRITELGHGASGNVHSALHEETFEIVAVKEVKFLADRAARHQTVRELRALQNLRHPNVVQFRAAFLDSATECVSIVLEYVLGGSLQDLIDMAAAQSNASLTPSQKPLSPAGMSVLPASLINEDTLKRIAFDLCSALAYCHAKLIAHLDVKPSNVLLTLSGTAKLADFGLARTFNEATDLHAATFIGTTRYMSPERLKGEAYSFPADIWGLGLSLAAAALARFPIDLPNKGGDSAVFFSLLEKMKTTEKIVTLPDTRFSLQASAFIDSCLKLLPQDRPRAEQLLSEFDWMKNVPEQPSNTDKTASQFVMSEIAEAVAQRLVEIETKQSAGGPTSRVITVQASLIANLASQLNLDEREVRSEMDAAVARLVASSSGGAGSGSILSDTMNSRGSKDSRNSRFGHSDAGGIPMKKHASEPLSDTMNSLLSGIGSGAIPKSRSPEAGSFSSNSQPVRDRILQGEAEDDDPEDQEEGLELHPL